MKSEGGLYGPASPTSRAAAAVKVKPGTTKQSRASIFSFLVQDVLR